jgi:DNA-binding NarL/FixJ family response regulator
MDARPRIGLVADDDAYFRVAVGAILTRHLGFTAVVEAASFDEAIEHLSENAWTDAALFDLSMPGMSTPTNLRAVRECFPAARVSVISASSCRRNILRALDAGVHGYILKSLSVSELVSALTMVLNGGIYVPPCLADLPSSADDSAKLRQPIEVAEAPASGLGAPSNTLTARQQDVLDLLIKGKTNKEIALALGLGEGTVKIHMAAIFRYFGVNNRAAAAVAGARPYPNRPRGVLND